MHFICGQYFTITPRQYNGTRSIADRTPLATKSVPSKFKVGQTYTIYNIKVNRKKKEEQKNFTYMFLTQNREIISIEFDTTQEADTYIANLANVELPIYNSAKATA